MSFALNYFPMIYCIFMLCLSCRWLLLFLYVFSIVQAYVLHGLFIYAGVPLWSLQQFISLVSLAIFIGLV